MNVDAILVPQGPEYRAVLRGIGATQAELAVLPISVGARSLSCYLEWQRQRSVSQPKVLLVGLCGGLVPRLKPGDVVLYEGCLCASNSRLLWQECDRQLTALFSEKLDRASLVRGFTSEIVIWSSTQKRQLYQTYKAEVVDMEGFTALEVLQKAGVAVAMVRVVSDSCLLDIPNLNPAISPSGSLQPIPLSICLLKQPVAASRLIQGSLKGLKALQQITTQLFS